MRNDPISLSENATIPGCEGMCTSGTSHENMRFDVF